MGYQKTVSSLSLLVFIQVSFFSSDIQYSSNKPQPVCSRYEWSLGGVCVTDNILNCAMRHAATIFRNSLVQMC